MGKLGKKARKFAKKNLQSVHKRQRKMKSMFKRKASPHRRDAAAEAPDGATPKENKGGNAELFTANVPASSIHLDNMFSEDEDSFAEDISDSDGFLSEDSECPYILEEDKKNDSDNKNCHSALVGQNSEINMEIVKQKRKLDRLLEKDPKFSEFLQNQKAHLEQFRSEETYSDEEDGTDYPNGDATSENLNSLHNKKILTSCTIDVWCWLVSEEPTGPALSNLLNGFQTACRYGIDSVGCPHIVPDKEVFSKILTFVLSEADGIFRRRLGISDSCSVESFMKLESTSTWKTVRPLMKSYLRSCLFLLNQVTDCQLLVFVLSRLRASILFFVAFPSLIRRFIKITVHLWVTGEESLSLSSFILLRGIASQLNSDCLENCLSKTYKAFIAHCKYIQSTNMKHFEFLKDSIVELYSLDIEKCFQKVLASVQYLANILRRVLSTKKKDELKKVYSWQYVNCVDIWVKFITCNIKHHDLQSLMCLLIQVIRGMAHLFPGPRYLPLRFKCVQMLNQLSLASGIFIPVASLLFDCLEYTESSKSDSHKNAFNFASNLKVPKQLLKARRFHEDCIYFAIELLAGHFSQWSHHISFPEVATIPLILLKRFHERTTLENMKRPVKRLIDQVEQNCQFIQIRRDEVAFSPSDLESVDSFLQLEKSGSTSFSQYYASILQKSQFNQR